MRKILISSLGQWLGNQMFMYATGYGMARDFGLEYKVLPVREYYLDKFPYCTAKVSKSDERNARFIVRLDGLNTDYRYFKDYRDELLKEFGMTIETKLDILSRYQKIFDGCMSLHVRRGDFLTHGMRIMPIKYYEEAVASLPRVPILVFSDDIPWCKENLHFEDMTFVEGNDEFYDLWAMSMCRYNIIANSTYSWWAAWLNQDPLRRVISPDGAFPEFSY